MTPRAAALQKAPAFSAGTARAHAHEHHSCLCLSESSARAHHVLSQEHDSCLCLLTASAFFQRQHPTVRRCSAEVPPCLSGLYNKKRSFPKLNCALTFVLVPLQGPTARRCLACTCFVPLPGLGAAKEKRSLPEVKRAPAALFRCRAPPQGAARHGRVWHTAAGGTDFGRQ